MNKLLLIRLATFIFSIFILLLNSASAQDIHFTQFYHSPNNLNPALAGVFHGDERYTVNYRNQWSKVPVGYLTFSGAYDRIITPKFLKEKSLGISPFFYYDSAGDSELYTTHLGSSISYLHQLDSKNIISGGLSLSFSLRGYDNEKLTYNSQFNGELFNPDLQSGEENLNISETIFFVDLGLGFNWHYQKDKLSRSKIDAGVAVFHINAPKVNFYDEDKENLDARINLFADGTYQIDRNFDFLARGLIQGKGTESEMLIGLAGRYFIVPHRAKSFAVQLGVYYRLFDLKDAWAPNLELQYKAWTFGLSYDVNVSGFQGVTNGRGGPEIVVVYRTAKAKFLNSKNCKIF